MELQEWETRLRPYLPKIELLAEIPLSQVEHAELESNMGELVMKKGINEATRIFRQNYPASFVTYLAFKAAFNEERGFWDNVAKAMRLDGQLLFHANHHWGKTFFEIIEEHKLRTFSGVGGYEYVTRIRLHGGISAHSLGDFFEHIMIPSVRNQEHIALDDKEVLEHLLKHSAVEYLVDDCVRYFFKYGGDAAQKFFSKCRHMARLAMRGEPLPSAEQLGLRPYVLQAFENHLQNPPDPSLKRNLPRLIFLPYEPSFRLYLPPQPISFEYAGDPHFWQMHCLKAESEILVHEEGVQVQRSGREWQTKETEFILNEPAEHIQVKLLRRDEIQEMTVLKKSLRLLPIETETPLKAFRFSDGTPCSFSPAIPAQVLWLFYPADVELIFEGKEKQIEALHPFSAPWETWQAQAWDLKKVRLIRLIRAGQDICPPIAVTAVEEPVLHGKSVHPQSQPVEEKPLFLEAPQLRIPIRNPQAPDRELKEWHIHLESLHAAKPMGKWEGRANDLPHEILAQESSAIINLEQWLGKAPIGTYQLHVHGPERTEVELPFRAWHNIQIEDLQPYYLPSSKGAEEVLFHVQIPGDCKLTTLREDTNVEKGTSHWLVRVGPNSDHANLQLEISTRPEPIRVPLQLDVPHLRWAIQLEIAEALEWRSTPIRIPLAKLLQTRSPRLFVEIPLMGEHLPIIALHLNTPDNQASLQSYEDQQIKGTQRYLEFRLDSFSDTLRAHVEQSVFDFVLEILDASRELLTSLPLLRLMQELDIRVCQFEQKEQGNWCVHWYEPNPLRHRRMRLWCVWQPWIDPVEIPIPDAAAPSDNTSAVGWWMMDIPPEFGLPPSWYRIQFIAAAPDDAPPLPKVPPSNSIEMNLVDPKKRLAQIKKELEIPSARIYALHAEKACIFDSQNRITERDEEIRWCSSHWNEANLLIVFGFQHWLAGRDPITRRAFLMHMFGTESLEKLHAYQDEFIQQYLTLVSEAKTIKPDNAWLILKMAKRPDILYKAIQVLIKSENSQAIEYLWQEIEEGHFSETDAIQVIIGNPSFAVHELQKKADSPLRKRILLELSKEYPMPEEFVWVGYWVNSDAGWGKIIEIHNAEREDMFFPQKERPQILVDMWESDTTVVLDLFSGYLLMKERRSAYLCGCNQFIAPRGSEYWEVWEHHGRVCNLANRMFPIQFPYKIKRVLRYEASPPKDVYSIL